ncbi:MAG: S49 family peptidase [Pseudomonadota bacterium]
MIDRLPIPFRQRTPRVSVVRLQGVIAAGGSRGTLNHAQLAPVLERAFRRNRPAAVAIVVNSPGGSPVQSALIGSHLRRLSDELEVPLHAFVEDVAASGGYWLAAAADDIWLDRSSITGSIGVISAGFGFQDLMARYGIERRVHTAGEDKSMLDPFRPEREEDVVRLKALQHAIHEHFIDHVRSRRGARLSDDRNLFTGEIFVGQGAVDAGLADGIDHLVPRMKAIYGDKVRFQSFAARRPLFGRLMPGVIDAVVDRIDARAHWARYGL